MPRSAGAPSTLESRWEALPGSVRWPKVMDVCLMNHRLTDWALSPVDFPGSFPLASRFLRLALTAIAGLLFSFSSQLAIAQTTPTSPSTSASASADKGVWAWQYTKDGREFAKLSEADVDGLSRAEKKDYYAWKNAQLDQAVVSLDQWIVAGKQAVVSKTNEWKELDKTLIAQQLRTLEQFIRLSKNGGTNTPIYKQLKSDFQWMLASGQPPAVVEKIISTPGLAEIIRKV